MLFNQSSKESILNSQAYQIDQNNNNQGIQLFKKNILRSVMIINE